MYEQDYIMRLIKEMVRAVLKLLFHIDTETPTSELVEDAQAKEQAEELLRKLDSGRINEAENELYDLLENKTMENLLIGLLFYSHLNEMDQEFLLANNYTKDEVKDGLEHLVSEFGLDGVTDAFTLE